MKNISEILEKINKSNKVSQIRNSNPNLGDWFELAVQEQLIKFERDEKSIRDKMSSLNDKLSGEETDNGIPCNADLEIFNEMGGLYNEQREINEQHYSIWEMIFVNLFKTMEIAIKTQLSIAYPDINLNDLYKWENIKDFLRAKGVNIGTFPDYQTINEIRLINNNIKHSAEINESVMKQNIPEFRDLKYFDSSSFKKYYLRIKDVPKKFLTIMADAIISDLYDFSDDRLAKIAKEYKMRMDKSTIEKFISKLKSK